MMMSSYAGRGRYSGRGGRGGRGKAPGRGKGRFGEKSTKPPARELKFAPLQARANTNKSAVATYATTKDAVIQQVERTFRHGPDIGRSLDAMKIFDLEPFRPKREISPLSDEHDRSIDQGGIDIDYQGDSRLFKQRKQDLEDGLAKAYQVIYSSFCTKAMQTRIEQHPDFETKLKRDPIATLEAIKSLMMDPVRAQYHYVSMVDQWERLLNTKQQQEEPLLDYVNRFKQARDVFKGKMGKSFLMDYIETTKEYQGGDAAEKLRLKQVCGAELMAYLAIRNCDQAKYGTLCAGLTSQFSLGQDQYPKTIQVSMDVLTQHSYDAKHKADKKRNRDRSKKENPDEESSKAASFAQQGRKPICYCCGKEGHYSDSCDKRDTIPREQWHANKAMSNYQENRRVTDDSEELTQNTEDNESASAARTTSGVNRRSGSTNPSQSRSSSREVVSWSGLQLQESCNHQQADDRFAHLKNVILLDTGSTLKATFMNPDMVVDIQEIESPVSMTTNAGNKMVTHEATIPGSGQTLFDPSQIANIYGFSHMADEHRITYDSSVEDAFVVHLPEGIIKFERTTDGLYAYRPSANFKKQVKESKEKTRPNVSQLVTTVKENRMGFTERQFDRAKQARRLYHIVGCPSLENFKHILRQNIIKNCPVTSEDVNIAEKIFGGDIGTLKGKTTRRRPTPVRDDLVEIPPELLLQHQDLTFCMDIMYVNGMPMLTGIDRSIRFRGLVPLASRVASELYRALDVILRAYNQRGYTVKTIICDGEFRTLMDEVNDTMGIEMNYTSRGEHVPEAERNNRTIGERIRATYHNLPYQIIPKIMLKYLAMVVTHQLNLFPAKGGVSAYLSPHVLLTGRNLDFAKHCQVPFGSYVQVNQENDPTNTQAPRTIDAIYLRPMKNRQGGHEVMNLVTGQMISRNRVWERPLTDLVISAVETMAEEQGITTLKLLGRNKLPIYPADWIEGVEYENYENENYENENENDDYIAEDAYPSDDEVDNEQLYERIDQSEIDDLLAEPGDQPANPIRGEHEEQEPLEPQEPEEPEELEEENNEEEIALQHENVISDDEETIIPEPESRPSRERSQPDRWTYFQSPGKAVTFEDEDEKEKWRNIEQCHNLIAQGHPNPKEDRSYKPEKAMVIARVMSDINSKATIEGASFAQQYLVQRGLKKFGQRGTDAATKEMDQLHRRNCFTPIDVASLTDDERRKTVDALMFLGEKRDKSVKGRMVYNGKPTREWLSREDSSSPTAALESIMLTAIVDASEGRDVMTCDIPNAFIQTLLPKVEDGDERVIMKITGVLVDLLVELAPEVYGPYVVTDKHRRVLYVQVLRGLYGMLVAALLWYTDFKRDLEGKGYDFNPYDPCVANKMIDDRQHTVRFHVDDLMCSHMDPKVNDELEEWLNEMYGKHGPVTTTRGDVHDYLGMTFDFSTKGKVKIDMIDYMERMVDDFSTKFKPSDTAPSPAAEDLFAAGDGEALEEQRAKEFHTFVAKGIFACRRARPDIHSAIALLSTRVSKPNEDDWRKLHRLLKYINGSRKDKLILAADDLHVIKWYVDCAFAVHPDFKSHTGGSMTYGQGAPVSMSRKQKLNTRSSTEAELVGPDDLSTLILWTKLFMESQGYPIEKNILYQDNKSTILLENNGKRSSSKRTRALNIRYFFLTDQIEKGNLIVEYCPTGDMVADYFSKPLQGKLFQKFRKAIMGH